MQSGTWPPVRMKASGRQAASVSAWILVVRPPRERPTAWLRSPPFPPAAQRCALTAELSISTSAGGPPALAKVWKISDHTPLAAQRTKRL